VNAERCIRAALALASLRPCLLCGCAPAAWTALYIPSEAPGRWAFYSLCARCFARDDKAEAAEAVLYREAV
jgi:hypothetical protein